MNIPELQTGDVLIFLPGSIMGRLAALFTWSKYSHAAMVSVEDGVAYCLEVREFLGGRKIKLAEYLRCDPTTVEVYRPVGPWSVPRAVAVMETFVGQPYGWYHVFSAIAFRFLRSYGCECSKHPAFCSEAVSRAYRLAGLDPRPDLKDQFTFPGDLAKSPYLQKVGGVTPQ